MKGGAEGSGIVKKAAGWLPFSSCSESPPPIPREWTALDLKKDSGPKARLFGKLRQGFEIERWRRKTCGTPRARGGDLQLNRNCIGTAA